MRRGDYKLIEFHEDNSIVLYNLKDDPGERKNLVKTMPELAAELHAGLEKWQKDTKAPISTVLNPECVLAAKAPQQKTALRPKTSKKRK
jgi:arylsulfatase A-like enzyme